MHVCMFIMLFIIFYFLHVLRLVIYFKNKYFFVTFNQVKVTSILMFTVKVIITVDFSKLARIDLTY